MLKRNDGHFRLRVVYMYIKVILQYFLSKGRNSMRYILFVDEYDILGVFFFRCSNALEHMPYSDLIDASVESTFLSA